MSNNDFRPQFMVWSTQTHTHSTQFIQHSWRSECFSQLGTATAHGLAACVRQLKRKLQKAKGCPTPGLLHSINFAGHVPVAKLSDAQMRMRRNWILYGSRGILVEYNSI